MIAIPTLAQACRKKFPKSPLRYPGGKSRAVKILLSLIPAGTTELVSPFFGGGSIVITHAPTCRAISETGLETT